MTIAGTAYRNYHPCVRCGDPGEQIWLEAESLLCYSCRNMPNIVVHEGTFDEDIRPHSEAIAEYLSADAQAYTIEDAAGFAEAAEIINELKRRSKELDAVEKTATKPMLASLETVRSWFRPAKEQATRARELWDAKIKVYLNWQQAQQVEVQRRLQEAAQAGDKAEVEVNLAALESAPQAKGVSVRQVWKFEVVNRAEVPAEYWVLDERMIGDQGRLMAARGAVPEVPGIRFWQEASIAATGR